MNEENNPLWQGRGYFERLSDEPIKIVGNAPEMHLFCPVVGTLVRNIYSELKGRVIWTSRVERHGVVFKLDNPTAPGHYEWNDTWKVLMEDLSSNGHDGAYD